MARSPSYLRIAAQLLALFLLCLAGCWLLDRVVRSRPILISGKVIDRSEFTLVTPTPNLYSLFASAPRYGRLVQAMFVQTVVVYRRGARVHDIVIPAIPATGLSGHVYGTGWASDIGLRRVGDYAGEHRLGQIR
jgi:hypothetical protein